MSANISIGEGGKPRPFGPVKALLVQGEDGKYYPWFPESDRALGTLSVDKNGIYRASDKGVYGWSRVYVNVPQNEGVTGRDPDTGEEVYMHPNPEGELVKDVLPLEIRVTTPPTKTTYTDGETIDYSGIVVHAYSATGQDMGEVPFSELVFLVSTAIYDDTSVLPDRATIEDTSILYNNPPVSLPVLVGYGWIYKTLEYFPSFERKYEVQILESTDIVYGFCYGSIEIEAFRIYLCSKAPFKYQLIVTDFSDGTPSSEKITTNYVKNETIHRKTGRYRYAICAIYEGQDNYRDTHFRTDGPCMWRDSIAQMGNLADDTEEIILYGTILPGGIPVPVQWPRTGDGAILETSFSINVTGGD